MLALAACLSNRSLISEKELDQSCLNIPAVFKAKLHRDVVFATHDWTNLRQIFRLC